MVCNDNTNAKCWPHLFFLAAGGLEQIPLVILGSAGHVLLRRVYPGGFRLPTLLGGTAAQFGNADAWLSMRSHAGRVTSREEVPCRVVISEYDDGFRSPAYRPDLI